MKSVLYGGPTESVHRSVLGVYVELNRFITALLVPATVLSATIHLLDLCLCRMKWRFMRILLRNSPQNSYSDPIPALNKS